MIDEAHPLVLGSASPRRREILAALGLPLLVVPADVDETVGAEEAATRYLERVVQSKLDAISAKLETKRGGALLVADTSVVLDGEILGKPRDVRHAEEMLKRLSGRDHEVWTRFAVASLEAPSRALRAETVVTRVTFRALADAEIKGYAASGEGLDKAGAYAIQGLGAFAVREIDGSHSNVIGLPACEVVLALRAVGLLERFPLAAR